jgi:hypothetical protein
MKFIHDYIHECDFPSSQFLRENKDNLIRFYKDTINDPKINVINTFDVNLNNTPLSSFFNKPIKNLIEEHYIVKSSPFDIVFNLYVQDNKSSKGGFHNHIHTPMTICGVMYLDVPKEGGEIEFIHYPFNKESNPIRVKPQEDKLYLFPSWLYHRPLPHTSNITRICINMGYISNSRPLLRNIGKTW